MAAPSPTPGAVANPPAGQKAATLARSGITWRSLLVSAVLLPVNSYWVVQMEVIRYSAHPTTVSLLFNAIFLLLVVTGLNVLVARLRPGWALRQAELLAIYSMVCVGSAVTGHDFVEVLTPSMAWPFYHATPENRYLALFGARIPDWLAVKDKAAIAGYFTGASSLYTAQHLLAWARPVLMWTLFIGALLLVMLSINVLVRRQWDEREALTYPLVQLPLEITHPSGRLFRQRLLWLGFAVAAGIDVLNSIAFLYPAVPHLPIEHRDLLPYFPTWPWNQMGWSPVSFYPFVIGVGALMPVDFLFSCWFFYLFWKAERIVTAWLGFNEARPNFPYIDQQAFGAYMAFFAFAIWHSRSHLRTILRRLFGGGRPEDDRGEPASYRVAVIGMLTGGAVIYFFSRALGMSAWLIPLFFAIYFALALALTRMRAQFGTPVHDLHFTGPDTTLTLLAGPSSYGPQDLTAMSQFFWFNRAYRSHPMPHQLEGFRLQRMSGGMDRRLYPALLVMGILGTLAGFWAMLHLQYVYGAEARSASSFGGEAFVKLDSWLTAPERPNPTAAVAIGVGFAIAFLLDLTRLNLPNFPFHPLGFAVSSSWEMNLVWMPLALAWLAKLVILRYGGLKLFRRAVPFFYGLILGQFVVGSLLNLICIHYDIPCYMFWQ